MKTNTYEEICSQCIDTMYHIAYVALADERIAEEIVTKVCVSGVHKCNKEDAEAIMFRLFSDLYRRCKRKLCLHKPATHPLPPLLQMLTNHDRLILAIYFLSGLSQDNVSRIVGVSEEKLETEVREICVI
ncbi:MAG: hypothetical protein E7627_06370 [Ruminococcaceae bacterium]|nr:hypothetical protein [Oscillospiraceae bacterium]